MNNSWYVKQIDNKVKISIPFEIQRGLIEGDLEPGFYGEEYKYFSNCLDDNSYEFQLFFQKCKGCIGNRRSGHTDSCIFF